MPVFCAFTSDDGDPERSAQGWKASSDSWILSGLWYDNELSSHINVLAMFAVENLLTQKRFVVIWLRRATVV